MSHSRKSEIYLYAMQTSMDEGNTGEAEKKRLEWEQAVTDELKTLDENLSDLENKIRVFDEEDETGSPKLNIPTAAVLKYEINEKCNSLSEGLEKIQIEKNSEHAKLRKDIILLQTRVKSLELENDRLISNVADVRANINESDFRRDLDRELANVKKTLRWRIKENN